MKAAAIIPLFFLMPITPIWAQSPTDKRDPTAKEIKASKEQRKKVVEISKFIKKCKEGKKEAECLANIFADSVELFIFDEDNKCSGGTGAGNRIYSRSKIIECLKEHADSPLWRAINTFEDIKDDIDLTSGNWSIKPYEFTTRVDQGKTKIVLIVPMD